MSYNSLVSRNYLLAAKALLIVLKKEIELFKSASTLSERILAETRVLAILEDYLNSDFSMTLVRPGDSPTHEDYLDSYGELQGLISYIGEKLKITIDLLRERYALSNLLRLEIESGLRRVSQKKAVLQLWESEDIAFIYAESFSLLEKIAASTSTELPAYRQRQGVVTLPVKNVVPVLPNGVSINAESNGFAGNSDVIVTTNNADIEVLLSKNTEYFEYERLDYSPCILSVDFKFTQAKIINKIKIVPFLVETSTGFIVEDILVDDGLGFVVSIKKKEETNTDDTFWNVDDSNADGWEAVFLPKKAKTITVKLKQIYGQDISVALDRLTTTTRRRYGIGLRSIEFFAEEYSSKTTLESVSISLPAPYYAVMPLYEVSPSNKVLYALNSYMDFESVSRSVAAEDGRTILLRGDEKSFKWKIGLERDDSKFESESSFSLSTPSTIIKTLGTRVDPQTSTTTISLPSIPYKSEVFAAETGVLSRDTRPYYSLIAIGDGYTQAFKLHTAIHLKDIADNSLDVFIGHRKQTYVSAEEADITAGQWSYVSENEIALGTVPPDGVPVHYLLKPEMCLFELTDEGYLYRPEYLFDPDKPNIHIHRVESLQTRTNILLAQNTRVVQLPHRNILEGSFQIRSSLGLPYLATPNRTFVDAPYDYCVDHTNGIVYLYQEFGADIVSCTYKSSTIKALNHSQFSVKFDGKRPDGILIDTDAFQSLAVIDRIGTAITERADRVTLSPSPVVDALASAPNRKTLSHGYVVKGTLTPSANLLLGNTAPLIEVPYFDGHSEFLGLVAVPEEKTLPIESTSSDPVVTFVLAARALYYPVFGVTFEDTSTFANLVDSSALVSSGSLGDYYVASDGSVYVNIGASQTLISNTKYSYYYTLAGYVSTDKYSVEYRSGVVYSYASMNPYATIKYNAAIYNVRYKIMNEISSTTYNPDENTVRVFVEDISSANSFVKLFWSEELAQQKIKTLTKYFSPILSTLTYRFN